MIGEVLYSFSVFEPIPIYIFFGSFLMFGAFIGFLVQYDESLVHASVFGILLIACAMLCFREGVNNKVDYAITKIETFTDYEKVNTDNRVVQLLKNNVFLVEIKSKKNNDETSSN